MTPDELDRALAAPLTPVDDNGFSARLVARVAFQQSRRSHIEWAAVAVLSGIALVFMPLAQINETVENLAVNLGSSLPVAVAFAVLALSHVLARQTDAE